MEVKHKQDGCMWVTQEAAIFSFGDTRYHMLAQMQNENCSEFTEVKKVFGALTNPWVISHSFSWCLPAPEWSESCSGRIRNSTMSIRLWNTWDIALQSSAWLPKLFQGCFISIIIISHLLILLFYYFLFAYSVLYWFCLHSLHLTQMHTRRIRYIIQVISEEWDISSTQTTI